MIPIPLFKILTSLKLTNGTAKMSLKINVLSQYDFNIILIPDSVIEIIQLLNPG